ncbi:PREDICTED: probable serine/threonine-protein kinase DDB_G0282963 isoform X2 [Papilio polytes]|uniref:probable serine/threonine-protein kinase DDB_G0282963 isoform X2 n=1 Tax=Papilio polytes TaxID=76194 RepID=UPI000676630D|nr:PREDICTED: probable serine/threonine-protein kinase DDB_G0282963 isoform X2 [Papilio polytes]
MPLFSEHISNMYYSGTPSYTSSPYSYSSSLLPLGTSYSASYLNPGASYSNHSSLSGYSRTPVSSRWISSGRSYSPMLSTISERGTSSPVRINSPRRAPIQSRSNRTYISAKSYTPRPVNINTADIDVSRDKYRSKTSYAQSDCPKKEENSKAKEDVSPFMPRVEDKPETGIDTSPGQRGAIKRERTVVRLHTLKRKERDSPRKPVEEKRKEESNTEKESNNVKTNENAGESKRWREKLSDDLIYKDTKEKKTLGEKLVEKFQVKSNDVDNVEETLNKQQKTAILPLATPHNTVNSKSPDRRCSMEMLAEQACLLDSLIRRENLSTATLDLSKIGTDEDKPDTKESCRTEELNNSKTSQIKSSPLTKTKSDHSLNTRVSNLKDQKPPAKRHSIKKSSSGSSISKLNSIVEIPKDLSLKNLPPIEESRSSIGDKNVQEKTKVKPKLKTKITSTVEITPPSSPLRFKVENVTVEEKPRPPRKEITFRSEVVTEVDKQSLGGKNTEHLVPSSKRKIQVESNDPASPEPEDGNFWNKIGKRETVYLTKRKHQIAKEKDNLQRAVFWYPESEFENSEINNNIQDISNSSEESKDKTTISASDIEEIKKTKESKQTDEKVSASTSDGQNLNYDSGNITAISIESSQAASDISINIPIDYNKEQVPDTIPVTTDKLENEPTPLIENNTTPKEKPAAVTKKDVVGVKQIKVKESSEKGKVKVSGKKNNSSKKEKLDGKDQNDEIKKSTQGKKLKRITPKKNVKSEGSEKLQKDINEKESERNTFDISTKELLENRTKEIVNDTESNNKDIIEKTKLNKKALHEKVEPSNDDHKKLLDKEINSSNNLNNMTSTDSSSCSNENQVQLSLEEVGEDLCSNKDVTNEKSDITPLEIPNIPSDNTEICKITIVESKDVSDSLKQKQIENTRQNSVKHNAILKPVKPVKEEKALKPLIATPRPLQKKVPLQIRSTSSSESSSDEETSDDEEEETTSSEGSGEFYECDNVDGRTSTGSNDSGFDSSASTSPAGFNWVRKGGECPSTSGNATQPLGSDILERELEQSTAYGLFRKTGRFTPPARTIPRFRKYVIEDFQFIKVLGKGSFGKVLLAELRDTEYYYAVKCLKKDVVLEDDDVECTLIERKVLALGTNHPYLCHLFATFQTDSHLFFVMEYLNGGDLMFHIQQSGRFPELRARFYAAEIVSGLKFLHKRGIIYRDLKLDNILLDYEGHVRIADFGMCKLQIYLDKTADTFCGTPDYMAPEIIKGLKYNQTVDWWSFGVLLYEMLIGQSPFSGCDEDELFWSICNEMPSYPRFLSQEALSILTRLLDKDARTRLGGAECMHGDVRDQDFFHGLAWDRLERRELEAPFKPRVRHPLDTQYFDRTFTGERPRLTAVEPQVLRSMDQEPFRGFSYTNPNATDR